ncbi:MAG: putative DNA binding domain-containing protein [Lewinellaceae bacterium]|nr:putative DNA binding domain-containing protein [Phaeodactylibacter sp.]MCB9036055.1 putative DNA binding domain-containing protein [Lewinellaceae bacterium]
MDSQKLLSLIAGGENQKVEFKNNFGREAIEALVAFANTGGGTVCVGVSDQGAITGVNISPESLQNWLNEIKTKTSPLLIPEAEVAEIESKKVVVLSIQEHPIKPVAVRGKYFKRIANSNHLLSTSEVVNMHLQSFNTSWDYHINPQLQIDDISLEKVQAAIDSFNLRENRITEDPLTFLVKNDLIRNGEVTNAAYLLFKKEDSVISTIELGRFQSDILIKDTARTKADLLTEVEEVAAFVRKHINQAIVVTGEAKNTQLWQYPLDAIREIVLNMIIHRDYRSSSDSIVKIFNHKIEFYNPGRLPENITVEDLLNNNYRSTPRNKLIADFCKSLGLIEKYESGTRRILHALQQAGLPMPTFQNIADGFMVTIYDAEYAAEEGGREEETAQTGKMPFLKSLKSLFASLA